MMDKDMIFNKFGEYYFADDMTFLMGIDIRFADHLAFSVFCKPKIPTFAK